MNSELSFDPATHTYRHGGIKVPGVTTILAPLTNFDAVPKLILKAASDFGTNVHAAVDLYNKGTLDEQALDPHLLPYLRSYKKFLANTGFQVTTSEQRVFNFELFYAGTCDVTGTWKETTWVLDIKSGSRIPRSVGPQLAAYQHALNPQPRRRLCVQLKPDDYVLQECRDLGDFAIFQSCLNIWTFKHAKSRAH